jgi:hypothetical protein
MGNITELMNAYRECSRNLWNVYFTRRENIGDSLNAFEQIPRIAICLVRLEGTSYAGAEPALKAVPQESSLNLIQRLSEACGPFSRESSNNLLKRDLASRNCHLAMRGPRPDSMLCAS